MSTESPADPDSPPLRDVVAKRLKRRDFLAYTAAFAASLALRSPFGPSEAWAGETGVGSSLTFEELSRADRSETARLAAGYRADVLMRWGDPVLADAQAWQPLAQSADAQARQFGYNNDFIAYLPLPRGSNSSDHGLLCVNHEYTTTELMAPLTGDDAWSPEQRTAIEMAAHGHTVIEIQREGDQWRAVPGGPYSRRLTAHTPMTLSGPAAGHPRLRTSADPTGRTVYGTLNNCAGGVTPWGTVLIAEENFHKYFMANPATHPTPASAERYGLDDEPEYAWYEGHRRFDLTAEPHEANRFGWVVEYDPYDPQAMPVKRTALGRFRHEGAFCIQNFDGRIVVYSGDDSEMEHLYRFVSRDVYDPTHPDPNILDHGTLSVARFSPDGGLEWLTLRHGAGPLTTANGFASQADVLIDTRLAASALRATPMDRPEGIEVSPTTGRVYVMLTNNKNRTEPGPANPRTANLDGHIVELTPPGGPQVDHAARRYEWSVFLTAGPISPTDAETQAGRYHPATTESGWFSSPDNCRFDPTGHLWIATDMSKRQKFHGMADGIWATATDGKSRALTRLFFAAPAGAEICSPTFTPDGRTLFISIQHPGEGGDYQQPLSRWPDFDPAVPPRPAVIAIIHEQGGRIGS